MKEKITYWRAVLSSLIFATIGIAVLQSVFAIRAHIIADAPFNVENIWILCYVIIIIAVRFRIHRLEKKQAKSLAKLAPPRTPINKEDSNG